MNKKNNNNIFISILISFAVIFWITACGNNGTNNEPAIQIHKVKEIWQGELPDFAKPPYPPGGYINNIPEGLKKGDTFIHIPNNIDVNTTDSIYNTIKIDIYGYWACAHYEIDARGSSLKEIKVEPNEDNKTIIITLYEELNNNSLVAACGIRFMKISSMSVIPPSGGDINIVIQNPDDNLTATITYEIQ